MKFMIKRQSKMIKRSNKRNKEMKPKMPKEIQREMKLFKASSQIDLIMKSIRKEKVKDGKSTP